MAIRSAAILLIIASTAASAQSAKRLEFDVASIHRSQTQGRVVLTFPGGRLSATAPLHFLIQYAFGVAPFQVIGGAAA